MEAFSLLKYWRGGGSGTNASANTRSSATSSCTTTTIVTAATTHLAVELDDDDNDDNGPFFDLEFAVPDEDETEENEDNVEDEESDDSNDDVDTKSEGNCSDGEKEFKFTVPIEPNSSLDSKPPQFTVSLLKSAAKVRVFLLKLKKSKLNSTEKTESGSANDTVIAPKKQETTKESKNSNTTTTKYNKNKFFTVKFKVEEVPIVSLFSKDNSKSQKQQGSDNSVSDVMQRYLKKVKPLYVKVSRRYGEKLRFSEQLSFGSLKHSTPPSAAAAQESVSGKNNLKRVSVPAGLGVVCKHLGNNRSAFSAVAVAPLAVGLSKRRDDSLLQQEDGVQSAILHCKRSFNGSRDSSVSSMSSSSGE